MQPLQAAVGGSAGLPHAETGFPRTAGSQPVSCDWWKGALLGCRSLPVATSTSMLLLRYRASLMEPQSGDSTVGSVSLTHSHNY